MDFMVTSYLDIFLIIPFLDESHYKVTGSSQLGVKMFREN